MNWTSDGTPYVAPDVETPQSKTGVNHHIKIGVLVFIGLASSFVMIRMYYHLARGLHRVWIEDYFLIAGLIFLSGDGAGIQFWVSYTTMPNLTTDVSAHMVLIGSLMGVSSSLALAFSKTSLAITFMRLTSGWWKSSIGLSIFVIDILFCVQAWSFWLQDCLGRPEPYRVQPTGFGECITFESVRSLRLSIQILSCLLDAYFTILPWRIVRPLELKRFEKIGLGIAMSFGCISLTSGVLRLLVLLRLAEETYEYQPLFAVGGYLCNFFEAGLTIVAACMPILRKTFIDIIRWQKNTSAFNWVTNRRKNRDVPAVLPISESPGASAVEGENTPDKINMTPVRPTTPAITATPSSIRSRRTCSCISEDNCLPVSNKKPVDLRRATKWGV